MLCEHKHDAHLRTAGLEAIRTLQHLLRQSFSATTYTITELCKCKHHAAHLRTAAVLLPQRCDSSRLTYWALL
jgi:hypothetical protein